MEVVVQQEPGTVVIHSAGDSRFDIENGNIIVAYRGGVEIEYYGYLIHAEELRYNKVLEQGSLFGNVSVKSVGFEAFCGEVRLDALAGVLVFPSAISGAISNPGLAFNAGQATLSFTPGQVVKELGDLSLEFSSGVTIDTQAGMHFFANGFTFDGSTSEISSEGGFTLEASSFALPKSEGNTVSGLTNLRVTGDSLSGTITPAGLLQAARIGGLSINSREVFLNADSAVISASPNESLNASFMLTVEGTPLTGGVNQEQQGLTFTTATAIVEIGKLGVNYVELSGGVDVSLDEVSIHADMVNVERVKDGYNLKFPGNLKVSFSMLEMSGGELSETGAIEQWLGS